MQHRPLGLEFLVLVQERRNLQRAQFFLIFLVIDFIASAIAFALERRQPDAPEDAWLLSQVWLQRFAYRQLFSIVLYKTLKRAIEGKKFAWDKLERTVAMSYKPAEEREPVETR